MLLHQLRRDADHMLSLPVLDHVHRLQGVHDVRLRDAGHRRQVANADDRLRLAHDLQQHPGPVGAVAELPQVGERLLRRPHHRLHLAQLVAEGNEEAAVAISLKGRQREDAGEVVALRAVLLLAEVAHDVGHCRGGG